MRIKEISERERPRERLKKYGPKTLSDAELLALILRQGSKKENVLEVSQKILKKYNLKSLSRKTLSDLGKTHGVGEAKACQMVASFELGRRVASFTKEKKPTINSAKDVCDLVLPEMSTLKKEHFKAIYIDSRKKLIKDEVIFIGSLDTSIIHPREIFELAITEGAAALILVHNHPSGDPAPSEEDIEVTKQLLLAGEILGIQVLDHIIIGDKAYHSFRENGFFEKI